MMNMILSVVLCFAMIFGGTGELPAVPETATTTIIRNITVETGDESVTLTPELRITGAAGAEEAALHFEIGLGENTLIPASGKITADGVKFELGDGGRSYSISGDLLTELAGLTTEEDAKMIDVFSDYFRNYGVLMGKAMSDPQFYAAFDQAAMNALLETCASARETEIEIDGETYPAQEIQIELTAASTLAMMDKLLSCGIPEVEAMFATCLELFKATGEFEGDSFAGAITAMDDETVIPMELVIVSQDGFAYESAYMEITDDETEEIVAMDVEAITRGDETEMTMSMSVGNDETATMVELTSSITGPLYAPVAFDMEYGIYNASEFSYFSEAEGEDYFVNSETSMLVSASGETVEGLQNMQISAAVDTYAESGYGDEMEGYGESYSMNAECTEALEEDGSVTASWSVTADAGVEPVTVSFDINTAEGEAVDYFADMTDYALTAEMLNGDETAQTSEEMIMLGVDAMAYAGEAYALAADESVLEMMELFTAMMESVETEEYEEEYSEDESYDETVTVATFEEAAEIFAGDIPAYTAPEGYELGEILVDSYSLSAVYTGEEGSFDFTVYDGYDYDGLSYNTLENGVLTPVDGFVVELYEYDGQAEYATIYSPNGSMYFYFNSMDRAAAEAVLAGLE